MLKHTLLLIYRNIKRYKSTFFINLIGLSTGLACTLMIYLWVNDELTMDKFHEKDTRLFQVLTNFHHTESIETSYNTPILLGETIEKSMPGVEHAVSASNVRTDITLFAGEKHITPSGRFASHNYFNIFSYPLVEGDKNQVLQDKYSIVISEKLARQFFNTTTNIIGKTLRLQVGDKKNQVAISGIFQDVPHNSSLQFDFVLSFELYKDINGFINWGSFNALTYLLLKDGVNVDAFNNNIKGLIKTQKQGAGETLFLKRFSEQYLQSTYKNGIQAGGRIEYVKLFSIIALFILVIACINFINLSTAKAAARKKEVGVKKVLGASKTALVFQYIGESMLVTSLSVMLAILFVLLFLSQFNQITGKQLIINFNLHFFVSMLVITALTGLLAGVYPALYLSGFNSVNALKGKVQASKGEFLTRKALVGFQFMISIIFIVAVLILYNQIEFLQTKSLGYDKDHIIYFKPDGKVAENTDSFLTEIKNIPEVVNASSAGHDIVKQTSSTWGVDWAGKGPNEQISFEKAFVNYDMIETLGIEMKAGRAFSRNFGADTTKIILNEAGIQAMGIKDPLGKVFNLYGKDFEIIGVAKNFHFQSLHEKVSPLFFVLSPRKTWNIIVKIKAGQEKAAISKLQHLYRKFNPGFTLNYKFLDEEYQQQYNSEQRIATLSRYFAALAILISCLGLFGLAAFTTEKRKKEIGIRKVIGASTLQLANLLSGEFSKIVIAAIAMALPLSYLMAQTWLKGFAYHIELQWWYFFWAGFSALLIAWLTVSMHAIKAALANPVKSLRTE